MDTRTYLPNLTNTLTELFDAGRSIWNHNRSNFDRAVASTQNKVTEIGKTLMIGVSLLFLTSAFLIIGGVVGSFGVAEKLASSASSYGHDDALLIVAGGWVVIAMIIGALSFSVLSSVKDYINRLAKF